MANASPHCPACAAPLPPIDRQEIVTCESCGTDCNADYVEAPMAPPRSPPLSADRTWSRDDEDPENWEPGAFVHALVTASDPARRLELARMDNGHIRGEESLLWAPALGEGIIRAEREGDRASADEIAFQLYCIGCGHRDYPYHFDDNRRDPDRPLRARDLSMERPVESKTAWVLLSVANRILSDAPQSPAGLIVLAGAGTPSLRSFLNVATQAEACGDEVLLEEALACVRTLLVQTDDDWRYGVLFDAATHLLPRLVGRTRRSVIDALAEVSDLHYTEWGRESPRQYPTEWRGPRDVLTLLLTYVDDLLHERPELAGELLSAIVRASSLQTSSRARWKEAMHAVPSPEGRDACIAAYLKVFGPEPEPTPQWRHPRDDSPEIPPEPIIPDTDVPRGVRLARARAGQAPCPACGRAIRLGGASGAGTLITTCDHCGQRARVAREVRTIRRAINSASTDLHTWAPDRLVRTMIETQDAELRLSVARELASATTDGARFVKMAPALVAYMMAVHIPEQVEELLQDGFESMLRFRDPAFLEALFAAIRDQGFTPDGSHRLLLALQRAGPPAAPLLLDLVDKVTQSTDGWGRYTQLAKQVAWQVLHESFEKDPDATAAFILDRMQDAGAALSDELPSLLGSICFDRDVPLDSAQRRVVAFIDDHLDPARITWFKGMTAYAPHLSTPHYSWTAEDIAAAERRLGLKWAQGGALDTDKITRDISTLPGSRVSLRQVSVLISQMESFWPPAPSAESFLQRLRLAAGVRHESTRVMILSRMWERPADLTADSEAAARDVLISIPWGDHATAWAQFVSDCLTDPGLAERTVARTYAASKRARRFAAGRARHPPAAMGAILFDLLAGPRRAISRMLRR